MCCGRLLARSRRGGGWCSPRWWRGTARRRRRRGRSSACSRISSAIGTIGGGAIERAALGIMARALDELASTPKPRDLPPGPEPRYVLRRLGRGPHRADAARDARPRGSAPGTWARSPRRSSRRWASGSPSVTRASPPWTPPACCRPLRSPACRFCTTAPSRPSARRARGAGAARPRRARRPGGADEGLPRELGDADGARDDARPRPRSGGAG